jgi:hypothetical protein
MQQTCRKYDQHTALTLILTAVLDLRASLFNRELSPGWFKKLR